MENKIDIILKKLINEELDNHFWSGYSNKRTFSNMHGIDLANALSNEDTAKKIIQELSDYILENGNMRDIKINKLYLLTIDVLNRFNYIYKNQPSVIKMLIINAKELNLI
jgi:hypothetical protein